MLRRASTLCHFIGSDQPETQRARKCHISCLFRTQSPPPPPLCFSHLWDYGGCFKFPVLRAKKVGNGGIHSHATRGQRWEQEIRVGGGPHLRVKTNEPALLNSPGQSDTAACSLWPVLSCAAGRQSAGQQGLRWPSYWAWVLENTALRRVLRSCSPIRPGLCAMPVFHRHNPCPRSTISCRQKGERHGSGTALGHVERHKVSAGRKVPHTEPPGSISLSTRFCSDHKDPCHHSFPLGWKVSLLHSCCHWCFLTSNPLSRYTFTITLSTLSPSYSWKSISTYHVDYYLLSSSP